MSATPEYEDLLAKREAFHEKLMATGVTETAINRTGVDWAHLRRIHILPGCPFVEGEE